MKLNREALQKLPGQVRKGALIIIGGFLILSLIFYIFVWPEIGTGGTTEDQALPPLSSTQTLAPTEIQQFMENHGPWLSTTDSLNLRKSEGVRNLALFQDNGVRYSAKSVLFDSGTPWSPAQTPPFITGVSVEISTLEIRTQKGVLYTINVTQPFTVEGHTATVYIIDTNRTLWSASTTDLSFVDAETVADPRLPANPDLSVSIES